MIARILILFATIGVANYIIGVNWHAAFMFAIGCAWGLIWQRIDPAGVTQP